MLPKGPLGYAMLKKLKCYAGAEHPHAAQQPKASGNLTDPRIWLLNTMVRAAARRLSRACL